MDIARSYEALETQQGRRRQAAGGAYVLDRPAFSHFYEHVLREGVPEGSAHIFTLEAGGEIVAVLLGLTHNRAFTLLRISNGGERWHHLSPGRLIVVEAMRYFLARGVTTFDMGIGDYAFKRGFGIEPEPLADLVAGLTLRGKAVAAIHRAKTRLRQSPNSRRWPIGCAAGLISHHVMPRRRPRQSSANAVSRPEQKRSPQRLRNLVVGGRLSRVNTRSPRDAAMTLVCCRVSSLLAVCQQNAPLSLESIRYKAARIQQSARHRQPWPRKRVS